jgi:hypothetical protein
MDLASLRAFAFKNQHGRCYYCRQPMWQKSPSEIGLSLRHGRHFQCTAEHLQALQDGGRDTAGNIVAACWFCNSRRHRRGDPAPSPQAYKALVQQRMAAGRWRPERIKAVRPKR